MQLTGVTGQDKYTRKKDWWENRALNESKEPSAVAWWGDPALAEFMSGERLSRQWGEQSNSSDTDPEGSVHVRSLSWVYPERMLNHPFPYSTAQLCSTRLFCINPKASFGQNVLYQSRNLQEKSKCQYGTRSGRDCTVTAAQRYAKVWTLPLSPLSCRRNNWLDLGEETFPITDLIVNVMLNTGKKA